MKSPLPKFIKSKRDKPREHCQHQLAADGQSPVAELQATAETGEKAAGASSAEKNYTSLATIADGKCADCKKLKHDARVYRWKLIAGLLIPYMLSSLDLTIVATASPIVANHFGKLNQVNWIATAYALTSTAFIPTYGQLADILGRHATVQIAIAFMLVGSVLCAAAQAWGMFLLGRALQGTSAAGLMNIIRIILSDKVSLEDNSKNTTVFAMVSGISYSIGPIIGGYLTNASWRYCFVLPIPLCVIASVILFFLLRKELVRGTHQDLSWRKPSSLVSIFSTVDVGGTILFIFGVGLIILATAWGGSTYPWDSAAVLVPLVIGPVLFFGFFFYEYLLEPGRLVNRMFPTQVSMIPWSLFERRDTFLLAVINFATGAAIYSIFYFMGLYFIVAQGTRPSEAGISLLFYIPGMGAGVYICMFMCNIWPGQTYWPLLLGSCVEATGFGLVTWAVTTSNTALVRAIMVVAGVGTGLRFMPGSLHGVGVWPNRIASTLSVMAFAVPFGGTLALTIMGSVFNNKMAEFTQELGAGTISSGSQPRPSSHSLLEAIRKLPPSLREAIRHAAAKAVMWAFVSILPLMACCVLAAALLGNVWIKGKKKDGTTQVIYSSYLVALVTGTVKSKQVSNQPVPSQQQE